MSSSTTPSSILDSIKESIPTDVNDLKPSWDFLNAKDMYRDTWVRYLGYANEVGESFGPVFPKFVKPSYGIAFGYVFADTGDKIYKSYKQDKPIAEIAYRGLDCLAWQTLASVLIPGYLIRVVTQTSNKIINKGVEKPGMMRRFTPTLIGLATIPFIIKPIDLAVDTFFDNSIRTIAPVGTRSLHQSGTH